MLKKQSNWFHHFTKCKYICLCHAGNYNIL